MKKGLIFLLCAILLAALAVGGIGLFTWQGVTENTMPRPTVRVMDQDLAYDTYEWHTPVFGGLLYKDFSGKTETALDLGEVETGTNIPYEGPSGYDILATLWVGEEAHQPIEADGSYFFKVSGEGPQQIDIACTLPQRDGEGYGVFTYSVSFTVVEAAEPEPEEPQLPAIPTMVHDTDPLKQGDVFSIRLYALDEGVVPTALTELGLAVFTPTEDEGGWYCSIPIGNTRAPGDYTVQVDAGEVFSDTITVTVEKFDFVEQDLTIDVTDPVISEANSAEAYQQYREKIPPLWNTWDEERYWQGTFIQPAEGRISTEFGTIRYTNGDYSSPSTHWGMDIANAEGSPIVAPAAGRVVLAEYLLNTGNTIVIEHGGGLKTYYFHMFELNVAEGDMVEQGRQIGAIGTTGYSTGPHLHFEVRIGNQAISPHMLFEDTAGLYAAEADGPPYAIPLD